MGKSKKDIEEMPDDVYLAVKYHISTPIMTRFLLALKKGWKSFMIPAYWLGKTTFKQLHEIGLDCEAQPKRNFFGQDYYQLYRYNNK